MTKNTRRKLDQYFTPEKAVKQLLEHLPFELVDLEEDCSYSILEPCCGDSAIPNALKKYLGDAMLYIEDIYRNDVDERFSVDSHKDMTLEENWDHGYHYVITNPPFNEAHKIIPLAYKYCKKATIALLRLSWLEPCANRVEFLTKHPPNYLLVTPRIPFTGKGTDKVTTAWFIWTKDLVNNSSIKVLGK